MAAQKIHQHNLDFNHDKISNQKNRKPQPKTNETHQIQSHVLVPATSETPNLVPQKNKINDRLVEEPTLAVSRKHNLMHPMFLKRVVAAAQKKIELLYMFKYNWPKPQNQGSLSQT